MGKFLFALLMLAGITLKSQTTLSNTLAANPNPFVQVTSVSFTVTANDTITIKVTNISGQIIATLHNHVFFAAGVYQANLDLSAFPEGIYYVTMTYGSSTTKILKVIKSVSAGIPAVAAYNSFLIYPNPAHSTLTFETDNSYIGGDYQLNNTVGQAILAGTLTGNRQELDLSSYPTGIYFLKIRSKDWFLIHRIVKE